MFNFGYLSPGHSIFTREDPRLFREGKRGPRRRKFGMRYSSLYYLLDVSQAAPVTVI